MANTEALKQEHEKKEKSLKNNSHIIWVYRCLTTSTSMNTTSTTWKVESVNLKTVFKLPRDQKLACNTVSTDNDYIKKRNEKKVGISLKKVKLLYSMSVLFWKGENVCH